MPRTRRTHASTHGDTGCHPEQPGGADSSKHRDGGRCERAQEREPRRSLRAGTATMATRQGPQVSPQRQSGWRLGQSTLQGWLGKRLVETTGPGGEGLQEHRGRGVVLRHGAVGVAPRRPAQHQQTRDRVHPVLSDEGHAVHGAGHVQGHDGLAEGQSREPTGAHPVPPSDTAAALHLGLAAASGSLRGHGRGEGAGSGDDDLAGGRHSPVPRRP